MFTTCKCKSTVAKLLTIDSLVVTGVLEIRTASIYMVDDNKESQPTFWLQHHWASTITNQTTLCCPTKGQPSTGLAPTRWLRYLQHLHTVGKPWGFLHKLAQGQACHLSVTPFSTLLEHNVATVALDYTAATMALVLLQ